MSVDSGLLVKQNRTSEYVTLDLGACRRQTFNSLIYHFKTDVSCYLPCNNGKKVFISVLME